MSDQKKTARARKKKDGTEQNAPVVDKATKEEYNIARWMRSNVPVKKTKFLSHTVEYFTGCKAVDQLLDSPWAQPQKPGEEALFTTRESVVTYLDTMLRHKLFHRARKIIVPENELKSKKKKDREEKNQKKEVKEEKEIGAKASKPEEVEESSQAEGEKEKGEKGKKKEEDKKKRKVRLDMHLEQAFVDGIDAYVWIYEPTPYYYYIFGLLVVVAVIAVCLFPLWPSSVRQGVYYLSLAAAGFLVFILALAIIRLVVFCAVWAVTFGHSYLWLLPNLTEDVGFLASFWPLYKYEFKGGSEAAAPSSSSEETNETVCGEEDQGKSTESGRSEQPGGGSGEGGSREASHSETESDTSQKSQTGRDFELVDPEEIDS